MDLERRRQMAETYERRSQLPLFIAGLTFLLAYAALSFNERVTSLNSVLLAVTWLMFVGDLAISLWLASDRGRWLRRHWIALIAVVVPSLRVFLLVRSVRLVTHGGGFARQVRGYALYITLSVISVGSVLVLVFEDNAPGANIRSLGDALWWSIVTITTVGYGDFYPVTVPGRLVAVLLMMNGIAALSIVTASLAQRFVKPMQGDALDLAELLRELHRINAKLDALEGSATPVDEGHLADDRRPADRAERQDPAAGGRSPARG